MAKHQNLGLCQSFVMLFFHFYLLKTHKSLEKYCLKLYLKLKSLLLAV